jgi:alkyl sulfatase BDS1-like metallo-beta-lactamase superfamily hydrolase
MGFFDGNPVNWDPLPVEPTAKKFVEYVGGANGVIARTRKDFAKGECRWAAQMVSQVVFADPDNKEATIKQKIESGDVKISGRKEALGEFLSLLDTFSFWFNIVTP